MQSGICEDRRPRRDVQGNKGTPLFPPTSHDRPRDQDLRQDRKRPVYVRRHSATFTGNRRDGRQAITREGPGLNPDRRPIHVPANDHHQGRCQTHHHH